MDLKEIMSEFQLVNTTIIKLDINNEILNYSEFEPGERKIDVGYSIGERFDNEEQLIGVLDLHTRIECDFDGCTINIEEVLRGIFTAPRNMDEAIFKKMLSANGCASLYSIARANISTITSQAFASGCIVLPMVNFIRFYELSNNQNS